MYEKRRCATCGCCYGDVCTEQHGGFHNICTIGSVYLNIKVSVFKVGVDKTVPCCARMNPKYGSLIIIHTKLFSPMLKGIIQLYNKNGCQCNNNNNNNIYLKSDIHKMFNRLYIKTYTNNITEIHV